MPYASELPDFPDLLRATSDAISLPRWIVEKDYHVTRALHALQSRIGEQFLFKGWNVIELFSDDIEFQSGNAILRTLRKCKRNRTRLGIA